MIASTLVPRLLHGVQLRDLLLLPVAVAAAFVARAVVLFGILPLLSSLRLSQHVSNAYKVAITWGGLRGAVTLALALMATGFVLFTLLINGLTLRPVIRLLKLNRLSPLNQAIRDQVLALSLADVGEVIRDTARVYSVAPAAARAAGRDFERRIEELESQQVLKQAISEEDRTKVGLIALANRECRIILDHHEQNTVSAAAIERSPPQHQSVPRRGTKRGSARL